MKPQNLGKAGGQQKEDVQQEDTRKNTTFKIKEKTGEMGTGNKNEGKKLHTVISDHKDSKNQIYLTATKPLQNEPGRQLEIAQE